MTIAPERPASRAPTTEDARLAGMLLSLLPRIGKIAGQVAHERGAMTLERARILWQLVESPRRSGEIAQRCGLTPASVSELVDSLERDGFVRRSEDRNDRRVVVVEISARGRREIERVGELMTAPVAKIIAGLSADKRSRIAAALADLQEAFGAPKESTNVR
ncbi:MAG TPA: MarR family transcriptional regulator [Candidatus Limnocylindria bacterium]|jgi:DNA-binding MarR family transcriptional regulator